MKPQLDASQTARDVEALLIEAGWRQAADKRNGEPAPFLQGNSKLFVINAIHGKTEYAIGGGEGQAHGTPMDAAHYLLTMIKPAEPEAATLPAEIEQSYSAHPELFDQPDPRDEEIATLRRENEQLRAAAQPPLLPPPDALMSDWGKVGGDDITGDLLLDAFEQDEAETAAIVQTLSALRLKHLSEQLNVERARLDREHQATGVANPRSASIDRLLGLLTRRGEI